MTASARRVLPLLLVLWLGACSTVRGGASAPAPIPVARMVSRAPIEFSRPLEGRATIEVMINADGTPELSTLRLTGILGVLNRPDIESWLRRSTFYPPQQGGQPVAGIFKQTMVINTQGTRLLGPSPRP